MKINKLQRKYPSGFGAEIVLRPHFNQRFFGIIVDFGSSDAQKPAGLAHFLEHQLFSKKDGDISQKFEDLGASVNAFTSFNETMFYCSGLGNLEKTIDLLFELVGKPCFTKKSIEKEIPIIQQELAMYKDSPNWKINNALMQQMYGNSNLGIDVAGDEASVAKTNVQNLKDAYEHNYLPAKMRFIASGDFSDNQVKTIFRRVGHCQKEYFKVKQPVVEKIPALKEMQDQIIPTDGNSNLFGIGIRLQNFKKILSSLDLAQILLEIMLESKLSVISPFFEKMRQNKLLVNPLQISVNYTRQGNFVTIFGTSEKSKQAIQAIETELKRPFGQDNWTIMQDFLELQKKEWFAQTARSMNNLSYLAIELAEESLDDEDLLLTLQKLQNISFNDYLQYCSSLMKDAQYCFARLEKRGQ